MVGFTVVAGADVVLGGLVVVGGTVAFVVVAVTVFAVVVVTALAVGTGELPELVSVAAGTVVALLFGTVLVEPFLPVGPPAESSRKPVAKH